MNKNTKRNLCKATSLGEASKGSPVSKRALHEEDPLPLRYYKDPAMLTHMGSRNLIFLIKRLFYRIEALERALDKQSGQCNLQPETREHHDT